MNKSLKLKTFTDYLLYWVSSFIDQRAEGITISMDLSEGYLYIICDGIGLSSFDLKQISMKNFSWKRYFRNDVRDTYVQTLTNIVMLSEKVVVTSTHSIYEQACKVVFKHGVRTKFSKTVPKNYICTEIIAEGLLSDFPHRNGKIDYFILKGYVTAMALITYLIPITITDRKFGKVIRWPGKYTGLGSAFSALIRSEANNILPVYANFKNIKMKAFLGIKLHYNKYLQYIYINRSYIKWQFLYRIFNHILEKSFRTSPNRRNNYFTFVLNIECPETECLIRYRHLTAEIRPKNINAIVICFYLLLKNIKMLNKCVRNVNAKMSSIQIRSKRYRKNMCNENRDLVIKQQYLKILHKQFIRIRNFSSEYDNLNNNIYELIEYNLDLTGYTGENQFLFQSWLKLKRFHVSHLNSYNKNDKSSLWSMIYEVITYLLNKWCCDQRDRKITFNYLTDINYRPFLGEMGIKRKIIDIGEYYKFKTITGKGSIENAISKRSSRRKYKATVSFGTNLNNINNTLYGLESNCTIIKNDCYNHKSAANLLSNPDIANCVSEFHAPIKSYPTTNQHEYNLILNNLALPINGSSYMDYKKSRNENLNPNFSIVDRNFYFPKGTSPIIAKKEKIYLELYHRSISNNNNYSITDKRIIRNRNIGLFKKSKLHNCNSNLQSISKDFFNDIIVIGQLDKKYIICEHSLKNQFEEQEKNLIIFDQHGIDERTQLESLMKLTVVSETGELTKYIMQQHWILLKCKNEELKLLLQFTSYFSRYGFEIKSYSREALLITSIPEILQCLAEYWTETAESYYYYLFTTLKNLAEEQLESILKTGSTTNVLPTVIHKQMCKTACSSAVKFGRRLSLLKCEAIVNKLSECKIPFVCAHGRPTAVFINEISNKQDNTTPPCLSSLKQTMLQGNI